MNKYFKKIFIFILAINFISCSDNAKDAMEIGVLEETGEAIITRVTPERPVSVGDVITIHGDNFNFLNIGNVPITSIGNIEIHINDTLVKRSDISSFWIRNTGLDSIRVKISENMTSGVVKLTKSTGLPPAIGPIINIVPYLRVVVPSSGYAGRTANIYGAGFSSILENNIVKFNGVKAEVTMHRTINGFNGKEEILTVIVPEGATTGYITVEVNGGEATYENEFTII